MAAQMFILLFSTLSYIFRRYVKCLLGQGNFIKWARTPALPPLPVGTVTGKLSPFARGVLSRCDHLQRFPWWLDGKESACSAGGAQETQVRSLGWEDPLE